LANVERCSRANDRRAGTHLIRDFVRYVEEFEAIGSRESEGQIDEAANAGANDHPPGQGSGISMWSSRAAAPFKGNGQLDTA
jgi:hypothetical protein